MNKEYLLEYIRHHSSILELYRNKKGIQFTKLIKMVDNNERDKFFTTNLLEFYNNNTTQPFSVDQVKESDFLKTRHTYYLFVGIRLRRTFLIKALNNLSLGDIKGCCDILYDFENMIKTTDKENKFDPYNRNNQIYKTDHQQ